MNTTPGIVRRIQKAEKDYAEGDYENALIQALIAVAATSAARYPNLGDRVRFEKFLAKDFGPNLGANFAIKDGFIKVPYKGQQQQVEHIFYKFLRCELLHEADVPPDIEFVDPTTGILFTSRDGTLVMGYHLIESLIRVVKRAPENAGCF
ncbi:MAG TPA: hypothetical protein VJS64_07110 [Pyrinomonadaceae bacterium]|nr:hypothetical protein [Pyrinomonadaceae bacterium]